MAYVAIPPVTGGGGGGTITTSAPLSGDGSPGTPATIAAGAIGLTLLATQAAQTVLGNGTAGAASPVALDISGATSGLVATATLLSNTLTVGKSGGQTVIGSTVTAQGIIVRPNSADTTTGQVSIGTGTAATSLVWDQATTSLSMGGAAPNSALPFYYQKAVTAGVQLRWQNSSNNSGASSSIFVMGDSSGVLIGTNSSGGSAGNALAGALGSFVIGDRKTVVGTLGAFSLAFSTNATERASITSTGNILLGVSAGLTTTATDGFPFISGGAGAPTGVPTNPASGNLVPLYWDRTNKKMYVYDYGGAAWLGGTLPGVWT